MRYEIERIVTYISNEEGETCSEGKFEERSAKSSAGVKDIFSFYFSMKLNMIMEISCRSEAAFNEEFKCRYRVEDHSVFPFLPSERNCSSVVDPGGHEFDTASELEATAECGVGG